MMKYPAIYLFGMVTMALPVSADSFVMNDGVIVDGVVIREDEKSYVVEVQVTSSIKDERVLLKDELKSVKKAQEDMKAFDAISESLPIADGLSASEYKMLIREVSGFTIKYPSSTQVQKALDLLSQLRMELKAIQEGGVKLNGILYSADDYRMNAYNLDASAEAAKVRRLAARGLYLQALRAFNAFEADYESATAYEGLLPVVMDTLYSYRAEMAQLLASHDVRTKKRMEGLKRMDSQAQRNSIKAIEEQSQQLLKRFGKQKAANVLWATPHPYCEPALAHAVATSKGQIQRLNARTVGDRVDGGKIFREVMMLAKKADDKEALAVALKRAQEAGLPQRYLDQLEAASAAILSDKE